MKISETKTFEVLKAESTGNDTPKIRLNNSTVNDSVQLIGGVLEAQYTVGDNYLLFITEGNPLEEALYIYLIDNQLRIKDTLELSAEYASGIFKTPLIIGLDSIKFSFFEKDDNWLLSVSDNPKISFFNFKYPVKRKKTFLNRTWLQLKKF
ncbi:hypothetical protein M3I01_006660 [Marinomonas sp. RSW2]|uniref:Uncharacterized protein n=1 Tax=Marinomonas maritima TaxID=2940935 RepID=A0ABT5WCR5_9GAMM|nr:hypothetical protein [Marinomonas maritima]MDE8602607.1 hypothetical protein [Marinomonas maritima]